MIARSVRHGTLTKIRISNLTILSHRERKWEIQINLSACKEDADPNEYRHEE